MARPPRTGRDLHGHRRDHQAPAGHPHPDRRGRRDPARPVAGGRVRRPGAHREADPDPHDGAGRVPDRGRDLAAVRPVGRRTQQPAAVPDVRPARTGRGRRRRLPLPDGQRLQPVGARAIGHRPEPGQRRLVGVRLRRHGPGLRRRHRRVRADPGRRDRHDPAAGRDRSHPHRRRPPPGPPDAPGRAGRAGPRLLRGPDPRPRALRLPVLRDGRDPGRHLGPVADRVHRPERCDLRQHVRRPDHDLPEQPVDRRLASDRADDPRPGRRRRAVAAPWRGVRLGVRAAPLRRASTPRGRAPGRLRGRPGGPGGRRAGRGRHGSPARTGRGAARGDRGHAGRARRGRDHGRGRGGRVTRRDRGAGGRRPASSPRPRPGRRGHRRGRRAPDLDPAARLRSARGHRLVPVPPDRGAAPARPQRPAARRGRRPARQARSVDRRGPDRRVHGPARIPPGRALPDALRRGLSRADGDGVPPGVAVRHLARHLRMDPSAPGQVRDGRRAGPVGPGQRQRHERPGRAGGGGHGRAQADRRARAWWPSR